MFTAVFLILQLDLGDDLIFINYLLSLAIIVYILLKTKADLIVTRKYLIHSKRSILKQLSKSNKYEISEIEAIGCKGFHSDVWEIVEVFNGASNHGGNANNLIMKFKNESTKTIKIAVSRKKLDRIVKIVDRRIQRRANRK